MQNRLAQLKANAKSEGWADFIRSENDERALLEDCRVDVALGQRVCDFCEKFLRHSKGKWAGEPLILAPWQRDLIIMPAFSWIRADGQRRFRKIHIWVGKKNGKSTLAAALTLYGLIADGEPGAEVYTLANDRSQARIVYGVAVDMVGASPLLKKKLQVVNTTSRIRVRGHTDSWMAALSADIEKHEGLNAHICVIDEIHSFTERGRQLYNTVAYAGIARRQPLEIIISTAGENEFGIGYETYDYDKRVSIDEIADITSCVYIAEADPKAAIDDPEAWAAANPMLGDTIDREEIKEEADRASQSPAKKTVFQRYRLNQWVFTATPWLPMDAWDECNTEFTPDELIGRPCGGGIDAATVSDMTAFALCFPPIEEGEPWKFLVKFYLPEQTKSGRSIYERAVIDRTPEYPQWVEDGWLTLTPGNRTEWKFLKRDALDAADRYRIGEIGFDPHQFEFPAMEMQDEDGLPMVKMRQIWSVMSEPAKDFEKLILGRELAHGGNPVLRRQAAQVTVKLDVNNNYSLVKSDKKRYRRIDGIVACVMALARAKAMPQQSSIYETQEPMLI